MAIAAVVRDCVTGCAPKGRRNTVLAASDNPFTIFVLLAYRLNTEVGLMLGLPTAMK